MNPLMSSILAESEFIEADITYNETKEYPYLFNVVAFNDVTLDWVVVSRVRMDKQDGNAYALAFSKTFKKCKADHPDFEPGKTLKGVVVDWSDAEIKGLSQAVGQDMAIELLKGCAIHWTRSWREFVIVWPRLPMTNPKRNTCMHLLLHKSKKFSLAVQ